MNKLDRVKKKESALTHTKDPRPKIPADIRRRVLIEAGHRCAVCRHIQVEVHHIVPWSEGHKHEYENLIALCSNCHTMAHDGKIDRKSQRLYKANMRFAHDKFSQLEVDVLTLLNADPFQHIPWHPFNTLLLKRLFDAGYVDVLSNRGVYAATAGYNVTPMEIRISEKGRAFMNDLVTTEL